MIYVWAGLVVFASIVVYGMFLIFLPEWVGVTGKTALQNQRSHGGEDQEPDALSKFVDEKPGQE